MNRPKRRLPVELAALPCIQAEPVYRVGDGRRSPSLEGPGFDRCGNFYVCYTAPDDTTIFRFDPAGERSVFYHCDAGMTIGFAEHPDGRLFFSDMLRGSIRVFSPGGTLLREIFPHYQGRALRVDCMLFTPAGDLWFTDLSGTAWSPTGGLYCLPASDGYENTVLLFGGLAAPNGLCAAPDGKTVWMAESSRNQVIRMQLNAAGDILFNQFTPMAVYRNSGRPNMDSLQVARNGMVYAGVMFGGRAIVLDPDGVPVANILVPGYEEGRLSYTPNLALHPSGREGWLVASDERDACILRFATIS